MELAEDCVVNLVMVHSYFTSVKAGLWSLKHYIDWICKDERDLSLWETCLTAFYSSLDWIVKQRSIPQHIRVIANRIAEDKELPETKLLTEDLRMMYERIYNGKYSKSIYETMAHVQKKIVHVQKEEEIFASVAEMHSKKQKNDGNLNKGSDPSLLSTSIDVSNNHEQNQRQADYYESASDSFEEDDCDDYKAEDDNCNKDNVNCKKKDHDGIDDDFVMPIQPKRKKNELENSTVLDAVHDISENSSNYIDTELHKAGQPLKSPGFKKSRKSKRRKVSTKKSEIPLSSKTSSSDVYTNENSEFISASSTENIDEQVEIDDITKIEEQLKKQPYTEWIVRNINITQKFRQYQWSVIDKAKKGLLKWDNTYEILALASIIVISSPCPYPYEYFTLEEWDYITKTNPYSIEKNTIPSTISASLYEAAEECVFGRSIYMNAEESFLSKCAGRIFNDLNNVPVEAPRKISEDLHCCNYLHPFIKPLFMIPKVYEVRLNRSAAGSRKRPDFSCVVDNVPILNSEIKPLGFTPLQKKKDFAKVNLRAKKSINQQLSLKGGPDKSVIFTNMGDVIESFLMELNYDGIYCSWSFCKSKLIIDKASMPLIVSTFCHFVELEKRTNKLAEDFKSRKVPFTPPNQIKFGFVRDDPNSPQI
ncbi:11815_t:CDS:10, partial [Funneliformis geosporum]